MEGFMIDYAQTVNELQKRLAEAFRQDPATLNLPGRSIACKIDPLYYLALHPGFCAAMARWAKLDQDLVETALIKTGDLVTNSLDRSPALVLNLTWEEQAKRSPLVARLNVCFVLASFIDRALLLYAGAEALPISALRIAAGDQERVKERLTGKTEVMSLAFA
jgi:hypothetical protein